jgi:capsular exopolysaccharide synthesis family protein
LVTSAQPKEGKTCITLNFALTLAQRSSQVLIIDADLRQPDIAHVLDLASQKGLSSFLAGSHSLEAALQQSQVLPNLWILPSGPHPPNPAELLSSPTMEQLLQGLRGRFDHIVIDSPPALWVTDAPVLSRYVDGVILVVENRGTTRGAVLRAHRILENAGAKIVGAVLNKLDMAHDGYYGSYYRYYRHYYPEKSSEATGTESRPGGKPSVSITPKNT